MKQCSFIKVYDVKISNIFIKPWVLKIYCIKVRHFNSKTYPTISSQSTIIYSKNKILRISVQLGLVVIMQKNIMMLVELGDGHRILKQFNYVAENSYMQRR